MNNQANSKQDITDQKLFWKKIWDSVVSICFALLSVLEPLLPPNMRSNYRHTVAMRRGAIPPSSRLDEVTAAKRAQILIQGLIERTPADPRAGTSPPILVQLKRVNNRATVVLYSPSEQYEAQIFKAIKSSKDINLQGYGLGLSKLKDLNGKDKGKVEVEDLVRPAESGSKT